MGKKALFISCFDSYENRVKPFITIFEKHGYDIKYLYSDFDHITKMYHGRTYKDGISIHVLPYKKNISPARLYSHYLFSKDVAKIVKEDKPDFVYCMVPPNSLVKYLGVYKKRNKNLKLVFDVYDTWPESFPYSKKAKLFYLPFKLWGALRKKYLHNADLIISVSEERKEYLLEEARGKTIEVLKPRIPAGLMPQYSPNINNREISFCYLGMINHITDIDLGVKVLSGIAKKLKTVVHIIGEGQYLQDFITQLSDNGVTVVCHGCVFEQAEKNKIFELCDMGLNIPRKEIKSSMSLKAIEYMRVGLPFVNSAIGDIHEIVKTECIGINIDDINETIEQIIRLQDEDLISMHERCINTYDKSFLTENYEDIIDSFVE